VRSDLRCETAMIQGRSEVVSCVPSYFFNSCDGSGLEPGPEPEPDVKLFPTPLLGEVFIQRRQPFLFPLPREDKLERREGREISSWIAREAWTEITIRDRTAQVSGLARLLLLLLLLPLLLSGGGWEWDCGRRWIGLVSILRTLLGVIRRD
jgi:hypothetical protein